MEYKYLTILSLIKHTKLHWPLNCYSGYLTWLDYEAFDVSKSHILSTLRVFYLKGD
jgi:hypothetical protein